MPVDFHTHSNVSDGTLSPPELIHLAQAHGLKALALTDHDTVAGIQSALEAAQKTSMAFIPGIELSAQNAKDLHIVGLGIDHTHPVFEGLTQKLLFARWKRNEKILHKLAQQGIVLRMPSAGHEPVFVSRLHIAQQLVEQNICESINDAFARYIGHGAFAHVRREHLSAEECIEIIHKAGGIAVIAHINTAHFGEYASLDRFAGALRAAGADGLECHYYDYDREWTDTCLALAAKYGFFISGGSDFHGTVKHNALGRTRLDRIPDNIYDHLISELKKRSVQER